MRMHCRLRLLSMIPFMLPLGLLAGKAWCVVVA